MSRIVIAIACALLAGCPQPDRLSDRGPLDPRRSVPEVSLEPVPLEPMVLRTHADYDRWEDALITRSGARLVYALYQEALTRRRGNQRTFVRWMLLSYDEEIPDELRQRLRPFVDALTESPGGLSADVRYLLGFMAYQRMLGGPGAPEIAVDLSNRALADTVIKNWETLLEAEPDWVGPRGVDAAELRRRLDALKVSLKGQPLPAPAARRPDGIGAWVLGRLDETWREVGRTPPSEEKLSDLYEAAEPALRDYEDKGGRIACDQVDKALNILDAPTALGALVAHCAIERGNPFAAIDQVQRMVAVRQEGGIPAVLARLRAQARGNPALRAELEALMAEIDAAAAEDPDWARRSGLPTPQ